MHGANQSTPPSDTHTQTKTDTWPNSPFPPSPNTHAHHAHTHTHTQVSKAFKKALQDTKHTCKHARTHTTHTQVSKASKKALQDAVRVCGNPDIAPVVPAIIAAIRNPDGVCVGVGLVVVLVVVGGRCVAAPLRRSHATCTQTRTQPPPLPLPLPQKHRPPWTTSCIRPSCTRYL